MRSFDVFFDLCPNKRLSKQWWDWWFGTPSSPLWRHCNASAVRPRRDMKVEYFHEYTIAAPTWASSNLPGNDESIVNPETVIPLIFAYSEEINIAWRLLRITCSSANLCLIQFIFTWVCDYLSMLGLKLIHVSKRGHWSTAPRNGTYMSALSLCGFFSYVRSDTK